MVSSKDKEVFWVFNLVREKQANSFKRLFPTINIVATTEEVRDKLIKRKIYALTLRINNLPQEGSLRTQKDVVGHNIGHEYHL